jgi:cell division protein ZapA
MENKNYAEVLIDGKIYTLGGAEDQDYIQKVAAYINNKISELKGQPGFTRQSKDYQQVMIYLNLADDYFKTFQEARAFQEQKEELDREIYSLKHELIGTQMKLEALEEKLNVEKDEQK